jgi:hypothetical protein
MVLIVWLATIIKIMYDYINDSSIQNKEKNIWKLSVLH